MKRKLFCTALNKAFLLLISFFFIETAMANADPKIPFYNQNQTEVVRGIVRDQDGNPLPGATITEKGTNNTTVAGNDGQFTLTVKEGAVLVISYVGHETQEINADPGSVMEISLQLIDNTISQVVVTALGIKKERAKISYATQEVKGTALDKVPEANVANNLVGKVAGLNILSKTNLFENPEILLRGKQTLVVIDGMPTDKDNFDFWNLNPNDIENINVLKGTAAAALYGSLGINGAIMITTKKGKAGAKGVEVSYNSTTQVQAGFLRVPDTQDQIWNGLGRLLCLY